MLSEQSPEEKMGDAFIRTAGLFNKDARDNCVKAAKQHVNADFAFPSDSASDGKTFTTLTWKGDEKTFKTVVCKYEKDKGVTTLIIDGETIVSSQ
jgi:hypothetical protein